MDWKEALWRQAKRAVEMRDLALARSLGFDTCQQCGEWFQLDGQEWRDCTGCGRHCQECAESVAWHWCADCGHYTCKRCAGDSPSYDCPVCQIGTAGE